MKLLTRSRQEAASAALEMLPPRDWKRQRREDLKQEEEEQIKNNVATLKPATRRRPRVCGSCPLSTAILHVSALLLVCDPLSWLLATRATNRDRLQPTRLRLELAGNEQLQDDRWWQVVIESLEAGSERGQLSAGRHSRQATTSSDDEPPALGGNEPDPEFSERGPAGDSEELGNQFDGDHSAGDSELGGGGAESRQQVATSGGGVTPNSTSANETHCESLEDIEATRPPRTFGLFLAVNYGIIFVLGLIGNVITLYVLWCKGKKRTAQDVLIANLACSDILLCVFCVPIMPKYLIIDGYWTLGLMLCKIVSFAQSTSVYMSTYSLIYIGYIRYKLIVHPLENNAKSKRSALFSCLLTWLISFGFTLPYTLKVRLSPEKCAVMFCDEAWEGPYWRFFFSLFTTVFQFLIPLAIVGFFNRKIYSRLDGRLAHTGAGAADELASHAGGVNHHHHQNNHPTKSRPPPLSAVASHQLQQQRKSLVTNSLATNFSLATTGGGGDHTQQQQQQQQQQPSSGVLAIKEHRQREKEKRMRKANNRLIFVVIVFAHSWLPLNLFNMIQDYFEELGHWKYLTTTFLVVHQIACSSVIWNPILYAWMSETYRAELRAALPRFLVAKLASCLAEGPHAGGGGGPHGPASTSVMHLNTTNGGGGRKFSTNFNNHHHHHHHNGKSHLQAQNSQNTLAKAKSIDHISEVRRSTQAVAHLTTGSHAEDGDQQQQGEDFVRNPAQPCHRSETLLPTTAKQSNTTQEHATSSSSGHFNGAASAESVELHAGDTEGLSSPVSSD